MGQDGVDGVHGNALLDTVKDTLWVGHCRLEHILVFAQVPACGECGQAVDRGKKAMNTRLRNSMQKIKTAATQKVIRTDAECAAGCRALHHVEPDFVYKSGSRIVSLSK